MNNILGRNIQDWYRITSDDNINSMQNAFSKKADLLDLDDAIEGLRQMIQNPDISSYDKAAIERVLFFLDMGI